jgi:alcohol dehydrogenase (cytochrome c)
MRAVLLSIVFAASVFAQNLVTSERLVNALKEQQNWLTYWGDYSGTRHRSLDQINTSNVKNLRVEWIFQTGVAGAFQAVPLVVDGVMYFSGGDTSIRSRNPRPALSTGL